MCLSGEYGRGGSVGVGGIGLAPAPACLSVGPDHLDHDLSLSTKVTRKPRPVASRSFDSEGLDLPESARPLKQRPVPLRRCGDRDPPERPAELVLGACHVDVLVRVDAHDHSPSSPLCHALLRHRAPSEPGEVRWRTDRAGGQHCDGA